MKIAVKLLIKYFVASNLEKKFTFNVIKMIYLIVEKWEHMLENLRTSQSHARLVETICVFILR